MAYSPITDFIALLRLVPGGVRTERMPGLDFVVDALARAGLINLSIGQTAPVANQVSTAWFKPAVPSWTAEGVLFIWNVATTEYEPATPALWAQFFAPIISGYAFQSVTGSSAQIAAGTSLLAVQRNAPAATLLTLPSLGAQFLAGKKLQIVDFSTSVTNHVVTLITADGSTIMQKSTWLLQSTADQLAGIMLQPSPDLNSWVIAP